MDFVEFNDPKTVPDNLKAFACTHCKKVLMSKVLLNRLAELRDKVNLQYKVNSGYRCPEYNSKVPGAASQSYHTLGRAVDISFNNKLNAIETFKITASIFNRVGLYKSNAFPNGAYMHVDCESPKRYWLSYRNASGKQIYIYYTSIDMLLSAAKSDKNINWFNLVI